MIRFFSIILLAVYGLTACKDQPSTSADAAEKSSRAVASPVVSYHPEKHFTDAASVDSFLYRIARYVAPLVKQASHENKFDSRFDELYLHGVKALRLEAYHAASDGYQYFLVSRIAPSVKEKRVATGGRLKLDGATGDIVGYEEIFRTWKMEEPVFTSRTALLFEKMVSGEDLSPYYTVNTGDSSLYIEFPDEHTIYDKQQRVWKNVRENLR